MDEAATYQYLCSVRPDGDVELSEGVRLKAATEIMDRAGLKPGMELNVTVENVSSPLDDISKQLTELASHFTDLGEVQDAEVIDEEVAETQDSTESPSS